MIGPALGCDDGDDDGSSDVLAMDKEEEREVFSRSFLLPLENWVFARSYVFALPSLRLKPLIACFLARRGG